MEYQITQTQTGNNWELTMTCKFANETIARLIGEGARVHCYDCNRHYLKTGYGHDWARIEIENNVITLSSWSKSGWVLMFNNMQDTKTRMEITAQSWQEQEAVFLPAMRYFEARTKDVFREWSSHQNKRIKVLGDQIEQHRQELQDHEETLADLGDCLDKDHTRLSKIESGLQKHLRQTLAHFPVVGKRIKLQEAECITSE